MADAGIAKAERARTAPEMTNTQPPTRWVTDHDRSLVSVHGVRMPKMKLLRTLGRASPMSMNKPPTSAKMMLAPLIVQPRALATVTKLVERAVAMARTVPEDAGGCGTLIQINWISVTCGLILHEYDPGGFHHDMAQAGRHGAFPGSLDASDKR